MVKKYIKDLSFIFAGLVISIIVFASKNLFSLNNKYEIYKTLSDGFFVPAIILVSVGLLLYVANAGFFDVFVYGFKSLKENCKKDVQKDPNFPKSLYDYKEQKKKQKYELAKPLISGCCFLVAAIIFCLLFIYA